MNAPELALNTVRTLLATWTSDMTTPEPNRLDVSIPASALLTAVQTLQTAYWGYLAAITGLDLGTKNQALEVLYHFCAGSAVVTLRVRVPYGLTTVPSICSIIPSASFFERELIEMFGVSVEGTPTSDHLYLPDNWPQWVYPLRKDYSAVIVPREPDESG